VTPPDAGRRLRDFFGGGPARLVARSGIVDLEYYSAQTGRPFADATAAARHYLEAGAGEGLSLHPLFEPGYLRRQRPDGPDEPVLRYLTDPDYAKLRPHPLFDVKAARRVVGAEAARQPGGAWLAWVRQASEGTPVPVARANPPLTWGELRGRLVAAAVEWRTGASAHREQRSADTSLVVRVGADLAEALRWRRLHAGADGLELVYAGPPTRMAYCCLAGAALGRPVTVVNHPGPGFSSAANAGAEAANGSRLVFVAPGTELERESVDALAARLDDRWVALAQPLAETPVMNVHSAGAFWAQGAAVPSRLLADHPTSDAERMGSREVPATCSPVFAIRAEDFRALGGLDEALDALAEVDLSLRARAVGLGVPVLVVDARATVAADDRGNPVEAGELLARRYPEPPPGSAECLAAAGFTATSDGLRPTGSTSGAVPSLRWAIDIAATPGRWGAHWGDRHFATSLARSLRRLGQQVAVDHRGAGERPTRAFDDVILTLRGLYPVPPTPGAINLLWVISHPEDVTADELQGYDRVFAAGPAWAERQSRAWGVAVQPLLQCTDTELFHPGRAEPGSGPSVLFVGNTRHSSRPVVDAALQAGAELSLYGTGWEETPAAGRVVAQTVPNDQLGVLYAGAGVVLNDHWADMRDLGFVSNRLFDAVACGARVLSDPVAGLDDLFGGSVQVFTGAGDVSRLLAAPDEYWPGPDERRRNADRVRSEHSFDHRAEQLLAAALSVRAGA